MAELAARPDTTPVALHPNLPVLYRRKVEELERLLADAELGVEPWRPSDPPSPGSC